MAKTSPTQRSTKYLRDNGFIVARVEQRLHMPASAFPITKDAFGFGDLLAAHAKLGIIVLVQATGGQGGNLGARIRKIMFTPDIAIAARQWLEAGGQVWTHGWAKRGPRGKVKRWTLDARQIIIGPDENLAAIELLHFVARLAK